VRDAGATVPLGAIRGPGIAVVKRTGDGSHKRTPISHAYIPPRAQAPVRAADVRWVPGARLTAAWGADATARKSQGLASRHPAPVRPPKRPSRRGEGTARGAR